MGSGVVITFHPHLRFKFIFSLIQMKKTRQLLVKKATAYICHVSGDVSMHMSCIVDMCKYTIDTKTHIGIKKGCDQDMSSLKMSRKDARSHSKCAKSIGTECM